MREDPFATPAEVSGIDWKALLGRLLVIEPVAVQSVKTVFGESDAVRADVHVIDGDMRVTYQDTLVFPKVLASQLRPRIGQRVLGRLGQGVAKPGQSAPWLIQPATDGDRTAGVEWLAARQSAVFAGPATSATGQPPF